MRGIKFRSDLRYIFYTNVSVCPECFVGLKNKISVGFVQKNVGMNICTVGSKTIHICSSNNVGIYVQSYVELSSDQI